jgi:hypothetical protein
MAMETVVSDNIESGEEGKVPKSPMSERFKDVTLWC